MESTRQSRMHSRRRRRRIATAVVATAVTAGVLLAAFGAGALFASAILFFAGVGAVSNMTDGVTWGIWEPVNVVVRVDDEPVSLLVDEIGGVDVVPLPTGAAAQALSVAPVVITSSTRTTASSTAGPAASFTASICSTIAQWNGVAFAYGRLRNASAGPEEMNSRNRRRCAAGLGGTFCSMSTPAKSANAAPNSESADSKVPFSSACWTPA